MNVLDQQMVVIGPIVTVHFRLVRIDVVGEHDFPPMSLQGEADQADAGEELGGRKGAAARECLSRKGQAIPPRLDVIQGQQVSRRDLMPLKESSDPLAAAKEAPGLPIGGAGPDVRSDDFAQSIEFQFDAASIAVRSPAWRPDAIRGNEIEMLTNVDVRIAQVAGRDPDESSAAFAQSHETLLHADSQILQCSIHQFSRRLQADNTS